MNCSSKRIILLVLLLMTIFSLAIGAQSAPVTNLDTGETFQSIQAAIDDSDTGAGDTIQVNSSTYDSVDEVGGQTIRKWEALIIIDKAVTIKSSDGAGSTIIDGREHHVTVAITAEEVTFKGFTVKGASVPPDGEFAAGVAVYADDLNFSNNIVTRNEWSGINLLKAQNCQLIDNVFSENIVLEEKGGGMGIKLFKSSSNLVSDNVLRNNEGKGIYLSGSSNNKVTKNTLENNNFFGIEVSPIRNEDETSIIEPAIGNVVSRNIVTGTNNVPYEWSGQGIEVTKGASETTVVRNTVKSNHVGVVVWRSDNTEVKNNTIKNNDWYGVELAGSSGCLVENNTVNGNGDFGIFVHSWQEEPPAEDNVIRDNIVKNTTTLEKDWAGHGIRLTNADENTVASNVVSDNERKGIDIFDSSLNDIIDNDVTNNQSYGIEITRSDNNQIQGNKVKNNQGFGISVYGSSYNLVEGNIVVNSIDYGIHVSPFDPNDDDLESSPAKKNEIRDNTVEGTEPGDWWTGFGISLGQGAKDNTVDDNDVSNNQKGIILIAGVEGNLITRNEVTDNAGPGIVLQDVSGNVIESNEIYRNSSGINLRGASDNRVEGNKVSGNEGKGIEVGAIMDWNLDNPDDPEFIQASKENKVLNNKVLNNQSYGIGIYASSDNLIEKNTIKNNKVSGIHILEAPPEIEEPTNKVDDNTITDTNPSEERFASGIRILNVGHQVITDNKISNNSIGIFTWKSEDNLIKGNSINSHEKTGIFIDSGSKGNEIRQNQVKKNNIGIKSTCADGNLLRQNSIVNNTEYGVENTDKDELDAKRNWWGSPHGPCDIDSNEKCRGNGDKVTGDTVNYEPWLRHPVAPGDGPGVVNPGPPGDKGPKVKSFSASPNPIKSNQQVTFRAWGSQVDQVRVKVFNTVGAQVYDSNFQNGSTVSWNLVGNSGEKLSNGLYLFSVSAKIGGEIQNSGVRRLLVIH